MPAATRPASFSARRSRSESISKNSVTIRASPGSHRITPVSDFFQDLRYGCRTLLKHRGFTAVALATLALGIGGNAAIFSFVNGVLLKPLPYPEPERIVRVLERHPNGGTNGIATLNFLDWQRENTVFSALAAQRGGSFTLTGIETPTQIR